MAISWSTVLANQDKSMEAELARRQLEENSTFKTLQHAEQMRHARATEQQASRQLEETSKLRQATQEETARKNREAEEDRDNARFIQTVDRLSKGDVITDPKFIERAARVGMAPRLKPNGDGTYTYLGTPRENEAQARLEQADKRIQETEARNAQLAAQFAATLALQRERESRIATDEDARIKIAQDRERRMAAMAQRTGQLTPAQQIAFRTIFTQKQKENTGGFLDTLGITNSKKDPLDLAEETFKEVTSSQTLAPQGQPTSGTSAPKSGTPKRTIRYDINGNPIGG